MNPAEIKACEQLSEKLGNLLGKVREEAGISKTELSARSGLSRSAILKIETSYRTPTISTLFRIARSLEVNLWELIKEVEE